MMGHMVCLGKLEHQGREDPLVSEDLQDLLAPMERLVRLVSGVNLAQMDLLVPRDTLETWAREAQLVPKVLMVILEFLVQLDLLVLEDFQEDLELLDQLENLESKDNLVRMERMESQDQEESRDLLVTKEELVMLEKWV